MLSFFRVATLILFMCCCTVAAAQERIAYVLRYNTPFYAELAAVQIPMELPTFPIDPVTIGPLGNYCVFEMTLSPSGTLIGLDSDEDQLVYIDVATGAASPLVDLDIDVDYDASIAFDSAGRLWMNSSRWLYRVDLQTGATTLVTEMEDPVYQIAVHNSVIYASIFEGFVEVHPETGALTVLMSWSWNEGGCSLDGLYSDGSDLWGIRSCYSGAGGGGDPIPRELVTLLPFETLAHINYSGIYSHDDPFSLVVPSGGQMQITDIPVLNLPGTIFFAVLLVAVGIFVIRSRT